MLDPALWRRSERSGHLPNLSGLGEPSLDQNVCLLSNSQSRVLSTGPGSLPSSELTYRNVSKSFPLFSELVIRAIKFFIEILSRI